MVQVYTGREIANMCNPIGKYVSVQGRIFIVDKIISTEEGNLEQQRRVKLPREHKDLRNFYLIETMFETCCLCKRVYSV